MRERLSYTQKRVEEDAEGKDEMAAEEIAEWRKASCRKKRAAQRFEERFDQMTEEIFGKKGDELIDWYPDGEYEEQQDEGEKEELELLINNVF